MIALELLLGLLATALAVPACVYLVECICGSLLPDRRNLPGTELPERTTVIVPAHNEELGIADTVAGLVHAVREGLEGRGEVVVVADNCTDNTAELARAAGAEVLERVDPDRRGKGHAIAHGVAAQAAAPPDLVILVDADCRTTAASIRNLTLEASTQQRPVQADYVMAPPKDPTPTSRISGLAVILYNKVRPRGLRRLGLPCQLTGSGIAVRYTTLVSAPSTGSNIVEDMALGIEMALQGRPPMSTSSAEVWAELPDQRDAAIGQRRRWEHGRLATIWTYAPRLIALGILRCSPALLAMGLDLLIPPIALLVLATAALGAACYGATLLGCASWPLWVAVSTLAAIAVATTTAWAVHGRKVLPVRHLLYIPLYILWKVPLYVAFFARKGQRSWNRTARSRGNSAAP